jgi:hypothetical protein
VGLDAEEIVARYYGSGGSSKFYNLSLQKRTLVIRISLNPRFGQNETFSTLRDAIYKLVASSRTGLLDVKFKNDTTVVASISGFVTKLEAGLFNKEQEVQITIECTEPMLKAPTRTNIDITGLVPSLTQIDDTQSTAPHGFVFDLHFSAAKASLVIEDPDDSSWSFEVIPVGGFLTDDILHFSSELNNKELYITRGGNTIHLADVITPGSIWPILFPGTNKLALSTSTNIDWDLIAHYLTYWGV